MYCALFRSHRTEHGDCVSIRYRRSRRQALQLCAAHPAGAPYPRPWIAVAGAAIDEQQARELNLAPARGVLVVSEVQQSPAYQAGLRPGDIVQRVDGQDVQEPRDLYRLVLQLRVGDALTFKIAGDGVVGEATVTLAPSLSWRCLREGGFTPGAAGADLA